MCVIAIKPKNTEINYDTFLDMWDANPDGGGFAVVRKHTTEIFKGFDNPSDFFDAVHWHQKCNLVIHFRYATHGTKTMGLTHPFIIDSDISNSLLVEHETNRPVLFHNGIIHGFGDKVISDTLDFTQRVLVPMNHVGNMVRLLDCLHSKFVVTHRGEIITIGEFEHFEGLRVSNTHFTFTYQLEESNEKPFSCGKIIPIRISKKC